MIAEGYTNQNYSQFIAQHPRLDSEKEAELMKKIENDGNNEENRNELIIRNLRLALKFAHLYHNANPIIPLNVYISYANMGLVEASRRYKPHKGKFAAYSLYWIKKELQKALKKEKDINTYKGFLIEDIVDVRF